MSNAEVLIDELLVAEVPVCEVLIDEVLIAEVLVCGMLGVDVLDVGSNAFEVNGSVSWTLISPADDEPW